MRTRGFTNGFTDVSYGRGFQSYAINTPGAVGLAALTRMEMWTGQWFNNLADGMAWQNGVLGPRTSGTRDALVRARLLGTPNVNAIASFSSSFNTTTRIYSWSVSLQTAYGTTQILTGSYAG
jgi:hypothetical protein